MAKKDKNQNKKNSSIKKEIDKRDGNKKDRKDIKAIPLNKEQEKKLGYSTDEDLELGIPIVPEAPKQKNKITLDTFNLSSDVLERMKKYESPNIKVVLVNCERCKAIIPVPVPKKAVINSELPVVPISYVHRNLHKKDQHCITIHLDHDFDIRRQRISDVVISPD
ncbi:MAG: hypothetical protein ACFFCE_17850 [Promethearchaeota archaeon]